MHLNHFQFRAFAHVVKEGSFSAAAKKLEISQSAVTQHVSNLEATVGSKLLVRAREGIELTGAGREFFELAERYVTLEAIIHERIAGYAELSRGLLTIIANAPQPALQLIAAYGRRYPEIEVDFTLYDWTSSMERIGSSAADIGIITAPAHRKDLYTYKITEARYVLHCRADHPLARRESVSLREVCDEVLLLPEKGSLTQRVVAQRLNDYGLRPRRSIKTTTFPVMKEAILQGVGVGIFLDCSATEESRLVEIPILEMPEPYDTCLVIPRHKLDLRLMQSFAHLVRDNSQYREPQPPALRSGFLSTAKAS